MSPPRWPVRLALAVLGVGLLGACKRDVQEDAVGELYEADYAFTVDEYLRAARAGDARAVGWFLGAGMSVDVTDQFGDRALLLAAERRHSDTVEVLLAAGADADGIGPGQRTALIGASECGAEGAVRALLEKGADSSHRDAAGWTALRAAAYYGHGSVVGLLVPGSPEAELDAALLLAAIGGDVGTIDRLLNAGADVYKRSPEGATALMLAAGRGHLGAARVLLQHGANRFAADQEGRTASDLAAESGQADVVGLLAVRSATDAMPGAPLVALADSEVEHPGAVWRLAGARVDGDPGSSRPVSMARYREEQLPVALAEVDRESQRAGLRQLGRGGGLVWVAVGEQVPSTPFLVVEVNSVRARTKGSGEELVELVSATLRDLRSGRQFVVTPDDPGLSVYSYVDLVDARGRSFRGRRGDTFEVAGADGAAAVFRVVELRPREVLVERLETGEVLSLAKSR